MSSYKEVRHLSVGSLRALCIENGWYTRGTNEEYDHLLFDLASCKEHLTTEDIIEIAEDIFDHSDHTEFILNNYREDVIADIACAVNRACKVFFTKEDA